MGRVRVKVRVRVRVRVSVKVRVRGVVLAWTGPIAFPNIDPEVFELQRGPRCSRSSHA